MTPSARLHLTVVGLLAALVLLAGCGTLEAQQRRWIFQPATDTWWAGPHDADGMDDVWIDFHSAATGRDARLHGLWLAHAPDREGRPAPVLLYLHGARWNVLGSASRIRRMGDLGFSVLAIDYRGFGKSGHELPSEAMAYEDAHAAWKWLAASHPATPRYIFGHSLGGAVAVDLAADVPDEAGLIVEGSFTSIPDVVASSRWGWLPVAPLIWQRFDAAGKIARVGAPVLVVHGSDDALIPPAIGQALYARAQAPKRWLLVEGGSHFSTNAVGENAYRSALHEFFGLDGAPPSDGDRQAANAVPAG